MPLHAKGSLLVGAGSWYIWELGTNETQYSLPSELVEKCEDWFEEAFPNWVQGEPCWFLTFNGMVANDHFDRNKHSSLARCGNLFKSHDDAELMNVRMLQLFQPFVDGSAS